MSDLIPKRKDVKLLQERYLEAQYKADKAGKKDKRAAMDNLVEKSQEFGYALRAHQRGEGRRIVWRGMKDSKWKEDFRDETGRNQRLR